MFAKVLAVFALVTLPLSLSLWNKSHRDPEQYRYDITLYKSLRIYLKDGTCAMRLLNLPTRTASASKFRATLDYDATPGQRSLLFSSEKKGRYRITWLVFPFWLSTFSLAFVGAIPVVRGPVRQIWRRTRGLCEECGYNLCGNRSGRCPECGDRVRRRTRRRSPQATRRRPHSAGARR